jgi:hypothetical protein
MRVRVCRESGIQPVLNLWEVAGINRPWLDLGAEISEKRRRDRSLFLVAVQGDELVGTVMVRTTAGVAGSTTSRPSLGIDDTELGVH